MEELICLQHWLAEENAAYPTFFASYFTDFPPTSWSFTSVSLHMHVTEHRLGKDGKAISISLLWWNITRQTASLRIHLLLVKTENAAETGILLKLVSLCFDSWLPCRVGLHLIIRDSCDGRHSLKLYQHQSWVSLMETCRLVNRVA